MGVNLTAVNNHSLELQVWRLTNTSSRDKYLRVYTTGALPLVHVDGVYEFPVDPPLTVQAGDVLGIYQPAEAGSKVGIFYEKDTGAVTLYQTTFSHQNEFPDPQVIVQSHIHLPLVTVEVGMWVLFNMLCCTNILLRLVILN